MRFFISLMLLITCIPLVSEAQAIPPVYNGREFIPYKFTVQGTVFYNDASSSDSNSIVYDKVKYTLPLMYDIQNDEVITRHPENLNNIIIVKPLVQYFTIGSDTIRYLSCNGLKEGFYVQIYNSDKYKSFAKYKKELVDPKKTDEKRYYLQTVEYFYATSENPDYLSYKNFNKIIKENPEHKKALRQILRQAFETDLRQKSKLVLDYLNHSAL